MLFLLFIYVVIAQTFISSANEEETPSIKCITPTVCSNDVSDETIDKVGDNDNVDDNDNVGDDDTDDDNLSIDGDNLKEIEHGPIRNVLRSFLSSENDKAKPEFSFKLSLFGNTSSVEHSNWNWGRKGYKKKVDGIKIYEGYGLGNSILDWGDAKIIGTYNGKLKGGGKFSYDEKGNNENKVFQDDAFHHVKGDGNAKFDFNYFNNNIGKFDAFGEFDSFSNKYKTQRYLNKDNSYRKRYNDKTVNDFYGKAGGEVSLGDLGFTGDINGSGSMIDNEIVKRDYLNLSNGWQLEEDSRKEGLFKNKIGGNYKIKGLFGNNYVMKNLFGNNGLKKVHLGNKHASRKTSGRKFRPFSN